jgi:hypothetical protein
MARGPLSCTYYTHTYTHSLFNYKGMVRVPSRAGARKYG